MVTLLNKIIQSIHARNPKGSTESVFFAAFGKHPGWDDHVDDMGLETDVLVKVKRLLYIQGIGRNIDAGNWDKLGQGKKTEGFAHTFVWSLDQDIVVGRLWKSQDGKNRSSYPMIVCAHCSELPLWWVINTILPRLEGIEASCRATSSAIDVQKIIKEAQDEFRQLAQQREPLSQKSSSGSSSLAKLAQLPEMGLDREGLYRVLYYLEGEVALGDRKPNKGQPLQPILVRVDNHTSPITEHACLWIDFLLTKLGPKIPILAIVPSKYPWIDLILGEPTDSQLFCLRALDIPVRTSIPYSIDSEFIQGVDRMLDNAIEGSGLAES